MLDLVFDSVLDDPAGLVHEARSLRFARNGCRVDARVRGSEALTVELIVEPGGCVGVESWTRNRFAPGAVRRPCERLTAQIAPGVTSFLVSWSAGERRPVRTAWVLL